jgi:hypothetical protein
MPVACAGVGQRRKLYGLRALHKLAQLRHGDAASEDPLSITRQGPSTSLAAGPDDPQFQSMFRIKRRWNQKFSSGS